MRTEHGLLAGRLLKSLIVAGGDREAAAAYAQSQGWHDGALVAKAAISGLESGGTNGLHNFASDDFLAAAWPMSLLGKMSAIRRGSFSLSTLSQTGRSTGAWTGQSAAAPVSVPAMLRLAPLPAYKVTALTVASLEAARDAGAEQQLALDLARALALAADTALIDGIDTDSATRPASIVYGAPTVAGSGDVAADVAGALEAFGGDLLTTCWLTHPATAAGAGLQIGSDMLGALGGTLAGLPVYTSEAFELATGGGDLVLLDMAALQMAGGDLAELRTSTQAMIEMSDTPAGRTDTPTSAANSYVSMFQADAAALMATLPLSWRVVRSGGVIVITGADYARFAA